MAAASVTEDRGLSVDEEALDIGGGGWRKHLLSYGVVVKLR